MKPDADLHYCKRCETYFKVHVSGVYTGTALLRCPGCSYDHPRQFEAGIAVGCDPPQGERPLRLAGEPL